MYTVLITGYLVPYLEFKANIQDLMLEVSVLFFREFRIITVTLKHLLSTDQQEDWLIGEMQGDFSKELVLVTKADWLLDLPSLPLELPSSSLSHLPLFFLIHSKVECSLKTTTLADRDMGRIPHKGD